MTSLVLVSAFLTSCLALGQVAVPGAALPMVPIDAPAELVPGDILGVITPLFDPSGRALDHFYSSLRATESGPKLTRISVLGASHIAADSFTRWLRYRLQARFGDGGSGFVVPAKPWRNYNQRDANLSHTDGWESFWVSKTRNRDDGIYGMAGCSFESSNKRDYCRIETARKSEYGQKVSRFEIFYYSQPGGGDLRVLVDGKRVKTIKTRSKEAGPGFAEVLVPDGRHRLELRPRGNGTVTLFGVVMERESGVVMDSMGINGARASALLRWDPAVIASHFAQRAPDLVILAYGTNAIGDDDDPIEAYERRLDTVINDIKAKIGDASCIYVGPSDRPVKVETVEGTGRRAETITRFLPRPRQAQVIDVQRRVASRYGCAYWDWAHAMGGSLSMLKWVHSEPKMGSPDYVHLRRPGYRRISQLFGDALMAGYGNLPQRELDTPLAP